MTPHDVIEGLGISSTDANEIVVALAEAGFKIIGACPFENPRFEMDPADPCPICGDLGTFGDNGPSRCVTPMRSLPARGTGRQG